MCLISNTRTPIKRSEDIVCYKIFRKVDGERYIVSPFYGEVYTYNGKFNNKCPGEAVFDKQMNKWIVGSGYYHAYTDLESAKENLQFMKGKTNVPGVYCIVECRMIAGHDIYFSEDCKEVCGKVMKTGVDDIETVSLF